MSLLVNACYYTALILKLKDLPNNTAFTAHKKSYLSFRFKFHSYLTIIELSCLFLYLGF